MGKETFPWCIWYSTPSILWKGGGFPKGADPKTNTEYKQRTWQKKTKQNKYQ